MEPATAEETDRYSALLAETAKMKKPEVVKALADEFQVHAPGDVALTDLRALLAAERLRVQPDDPELSEDVVEAEAVEVDETGADVPPEVADEIGAALALREETPAPVAALPTPAEWNATMAIANHIAQTTFVPAAYRGRPADVAAAILFGREIGLGPMTAMRDVFMVDGRPVISAHRQLALLRKGGVRILESEVTNERAWIRAQRVDTGEIMAVEFTWEEAQAIRRRGKALVDGDNWRNYRTDMLWARVVGRLTRRLGPDLLNGLPPYVAEEVADFSGWGVEYGGTGEVNFKPGESRQEQAGRVETPKTWAEIDAWAEPYGETLGWKEWIRQAALVLAGTTDATELTGDQKRLLGQKASGAIMALREAVDPASFPPPTRDDVQRAWASVMGGVKLDGPDWRFSPDEVALPTYYEAHGLPEPEPAAVPAEEETPAAEPGTSDEVEDAEFTDVDGNAEDDIPFGEVYG